MFREREDILQILPEEYVDEIVDFIEMLFELDQKK